MEMRTSLALAIAFAMSAAAPALAQTQAQNEFKPTAKVGVQVRFDSVGTTTKVGDAPAESSQGFTTTTARLGVTGDVAENVSYTLRLSLRSAGGFEAKRNSPDGNLSALDRAFIEHRVLPNLSVKIGRMPLWASGSIEVDYSSIDQYVYSYISDVMVPLLPVTTGVDVTYAFGQHTISLGAVNGFYDGSEDKGPQVGENMSTGIGYRGNIGGLVRPIVTYNQLSRIRNGEGAARDDKATYTAYAVGAQVSTSGLTFDLEYDALKTPEFTSYETDDSATPPAAVEVENKKVEIGSIITQVAYDLKAAGLRFAAKTTSEKEKTDGEDSYGAARSALSVEYRPSVKNFRYHVAMAQKNDKTGPDLETKIKTTQYIVGVAAKM